MKGLNNMLPVFPRYNKSAIGVTDPELLGDFRNGGHACQTANHSHLLLGQLCGVNILSFGRPTLSNPVSRVFPAPTQKKMLWIATCWIIAKMTDMYVTARNFPFMKLVGKSGSRNPSIVDRHSSVPRRSECSFPYPTGISLFNIGPESFFTMRSKRLVLTCFRTVNAATFFYYTRICLKLGIADFAVLFYHVVNIRNIEIKYSIR